MQAYVISMWSSFPQSHFLLVKINTKFALFLQNLFRRGVKLREIQ